MLDAFHARCGSPTTPSTRCVAGCSNRPSATAAARATRSTGSVECCYAGAENLTARSYGRMLAGLDSGDPDGHVAAT